MVWLCLIFHRCNWPTVAAAQLSGRDLFALPAARLRLFRPLLDAEFFILLELLYGPKRRAHLERWLWRSTGQADKAAAEVTFTCPAKRSDCDRLMDKELLLNTTPTKDVTR